MTTTRPRGALIEIIEPVHDPDAVDSLEAVGVIVPREIRINGVPLLCPEDSPVEIDAITIDGDEPVRVTITCWARRIVMGAHDTSSDVDVDTLRATLDNTVPSAALYALRAALDHLGQPGLRAVTDALGINATADDAMPKLGRRS